MSQDKKTHRQGFDQLVSDAYDEAERAMVRFPQPNYVISKVAEEAGEVVKAAIHAAEGRETLDHVRSEMCQLVAMLYRMWAEGDEVHGLAAISKSIINQPVLPSRAEELEQVLHDIAAQAWTHPSDSETDRRIRLERIASLVRDEIGPYRGP
jgi:phosphoribosyl-ATP pyrophosphohydrolase